MIFVNKRRRDALGKAISYLNLAGQMIERVMDEEQDAMDNIPEQFQSSERYEQMEENIEALDEAVDTIQSISETLSSVVNS